VEGSRVKLPVVGRALPSPQGRLTLRWMSDRSTAQTRKATRPTLGHLLPVWTTRLEFQGMPECFETGLSSHKKQAMPRATASRKMAAAALVASISEVGAVTI
jgi:hypothetical protein